MDHLHGNMKGSFMKKRTTYMELWKGDLWKIKNKKNWTTYMEIWKADFCQSGLKRQVVLVSKVICMCICVLETQAPTTCVHAIHLKHAPQTQRQNAYTLTHVHCNTQACPFQASPTNTQEKHLPLHPSVLNQLTFIKMASMAPRTRKGKNPRMPPRRSFFTSSHCRQSSFFCVYGG